MNMFLPFILLAITFFLPYSILPRRPRVCASISIILSLAILVLYYEVNWSFFYSIPKGLLLAFLSLAYLLIALPLTDEEDTRKLEEQIDDPVAPLVFAPISEELAFRGVLMYGLILAGISTWPAIIITTIVFALAHIPLLVEARMSARGSAVLILSVIYVGVLTGYIAANYGIIGAILAHFLANSPYLVKGRKRK